MSFYDWTRTNIILRNLPLVLRKPRVIAWLKNLLFPLLSIRDEFTLLRAEINGYYDYNGLKHSMEWLLNDIYDPVERRIYIVVHTTPLVVGWAAAFEPSTSSWTYAHELSALTWMTAEQVNAITTINYEFTVVVHPEISLNPAELVKHLDRYRFAGLRPRVVFFADDYELVEPPIFEQGG